VTTSQNFLSLDKISKRFGGVTALSQASLFCEAGEVHGLVGQNGAGKSTLVKILSGVIQRDDGEIRLDNQPLHFQGPKDAIQAGIGIVFQELSLIPDLKVSQNIFFGLEPTDRLGGVSQRALYRSTLNLFEKLGIDPVDPNAEVRDLSLAKRQMVEIAKVLARDPKVVIFDEATSALGRREAGWLLAFTRSLAAAGKTVIYISHNLKEIQNVSDRITIFRNGRDVGVYQVGEVSTDEVVNLILGRKAGGLFPPRQAEPGADIVMEGRELHSGRGLKGVSFQLRAGEILGVGGLTGQGQDELFRGLYGIEPLHGEVFIAGKAAHIRSPRMALGHGVQLALVPEDRANQGLVLPMSVAENLSMAILTRLQRWGLIQKKQEASVVSEMIRRLSILVDDDSAPVMRLSGGNQQKVVLGKLLATEPKILLMYDSTRGVDVGTKAEIFGLIRRLTGRGSAVLYYSTDVDELINLSDRVIVMRQGRVEAELEGPTLVEENIIRASMGESIKDGDPQKGVPNQAAPQKGAPKDGEAPQTAAIDSQESNLC
jgi:ribose transport system ATP-binding protein